MTAALQLVFIAPVGRGLGGVAALDGGATGDGRRSGRPGS